MVEDTKKIIKSCCEMWSVFYKHVIVDRRFMPLSKIKHITQFDYNMIKWGLDKCTEHYPPQKVPSKVLRLEGKYVMCMFGGACVANSWHFACAKLVKEFIEDHARDNNNTKPSGTQIHQKAYKPPLEDHVQLTGVERLTKLNVEVVCMQ